jgi:hypothetical protein
VQCDFEKCDTKPLCAGCKANTKEPKGVRKMEKWFCSHECCNQYILSTGGTGRDEEMVGGGEEMVGGT